MSFRIGRTEKVVAVLAVIGIAALAHFNQRPISSVASADDLCKILYGEQMKPTECGPTDRMTVDAKLDFTGLDADKFCRSWVSDARKAGALFNEGWTLRLLDDGTGSVVATCPLGT